MTPLTENVAQVPVFNSEHQKDFNLYIRMDRVHAFVKYVTDNRRPDAKADPMPGISWAAALGLDAIFFKRPKKFPSKDILAWLASFFDGLDSPVTVAEVEHALERFGKQYPPDVSEDA